MISIGFNIRNPFTSRFEIIKYWDGGTPFKNKFWECQIDRTSDIVGFDLRVTAKESHAGIFIGVSLLGYEVILNLYDHRHWDHDKNSWANI